MQQFVQYKFWGARAENRTEQSYRCGRRPCSSCERLANDAELRIPLITSLQSRFPPLHSWFGFPFTLLTFKLFVLLKLLIGTGTCSDPWITTATSSIRRAELIATLEKFNPQHLFFQFASRAESYSSPDPDPQSHLGLRVVMKRLQDKPGVGVSGVQESTFPWNLVNTPRGPKQFDVQLRLG